MNNYQYIIIHSGSYEDPKLLFKSKVISSKEFPYKTAIEKCDEVTHDFLHRKSLVDIGKCLKTDTAFSTQNSKSIHHEYFLLYKSDIDSLKEVKQLRPNLRHTIDQLITYSSDLKKDEYIIIQLQYFPQTDRLSSLIVWVDSDNELYRSASSIQTYTEKIEVTIYQVD